MTASPGWANRAIRPTRFLTEHRRSGFRFGTPARQRLAVVGDDKARSRRLVVFARPPPGNGGTPEPWGTFRCFTRSLRRASARLCIPRLRHCSSMRNGRRSTFPRNRPFCSRPRQTKPDRVLCAAESDRPSRRSSLISRWKHRKGWLADSDRHDESASPSRGGIRM